MPSSSHNRRFPFRLIMPAVTTPLSLSEMLMRRLNKIQSSGSLHKTPLRADAMHAENAALARLYFLYSINVCGDQSNAQCLFRADSRCLFACFILTQILFQVDANFILLSL